MKNNHPSIVRIVKKPIVQKRKKRIRKNSILANELMTEYPYFEQLRFMMFSLSSERGNATLSLIFKNRTDFYVGLPTCKGKIYFL